MAQLAASTKLDVLYSIGKVFIGYLEKFNIETLLRNLILRFFFLISCVLRGDPLFFIIIENKGVGVLIIASVGDSNPLCYNKEFCGHGICENEDII